MAVYRQVYVCYIYAYVEYGSGHPVMVPVQHVSSRTLNLTIPHSVQPFTCIIDIDVCACTQSNPSTCLIALVAPRRSCTL